MKLYPNPQMPQRGGWWPDCLGVVVILAVTTIAGFIVLATGVM